MKRAFLSLAVLLYMIASVGMVIQRHYCMGRFFAVTLMPAGKFDFYAQAI